MSFFSVRSRILCGCSLHPRTRNVQISKRRPSPVRSAAHRIVCHLGPHVGRVPLFRWSVHREEQSDVACIDVSSHVRVLIKAHAVMWPAQPWLVGQRSAGPPRPRLCCRSPFQVIISSAIKALANSPTAVIKLAFAQNRLLFNIFDLSFYFTS